MIKKSIRKIIPIIAILILSLSLIFSINTFTGFTTLTNDLTPETAKTISAALFTVGVALSIVYIKAK